MNKLATVIVALGFFLITGAAYAQAPPQEKNAAATYVGTAVCRGCHARTYEEWLLTPHRRTLFDKKGGPAWMGCEGCHGPGGAHVAAGGGPGTIINLAALPAERSSEICLKCHDQMNVLLWKQSPHARQRLACNSCHDPHNPERATMLKMLDSAHDSVQGLNTAISDARLAANSAANEELRREYLAKLDNLEAQKQALQQKQVEYESRFREKLQPYVCFTCHKDVETQINLPSHHPIMEGKVLCSDCHNPHGGRLYMQRGERQPETCYRCHAEVQGPFVFQHPPVNEDCTLCHRPHGSQYNNLMEQQEPFVCLKCHAGPHSRSNQFLSEKSTANFYWRCTACHFPHGSDRQAAFHL